MSYEVHHGDCIEFMRTMPDSSVDSIVTDPPYGLGFMGKAWDALPPGLEWAAECLRVLKPGGHLLAFGGTRTWHRLALSIEDAGFEIRDSIAWMYGSGFPKHRATLKPAFEPIVMARKPFKGSLTANEATHGTGALSIDECRVPTNEPTGRPQGKDIRGGNYGPGGYESRSSLITGGSELGRWPANVVLDEDMAGVLNEVSEPQMHSAGAARERSGDFNNKGMFGLGGGKTARLGDSGGAARFFYVAKAPKKERPVVDGVAHATVKPLTLMRWLVRLVTPTGGTVLEPFAGSGTTVEACILEGFHCIAIEREAEYLPLIQKRIERAA